MSLPNITSLAKRLGFAAALILLGALAFALVPITWSTFAGALFKVSICVALWIGFDEVFLDEFNTAEELKGSPLAISITLLSLSILLAPAIASAQKACPSPDGTRTELPQTELHEVAAQHVGVTETPPGSNEGREVEMYMETVGLGEGGYPWCAGFVHYVMLEAGVDPPVRSAGATDYITEESISAKKVIRGEAEVPTNSLAVYRRGNSWKGHIGIVREWDGHCGRTVSGNTSSGSGSQREGDGVYEKARCVNYGNYFRIVEFTPTE